MSLPKRPKKHQIEDKSVHVFKQSMPASWVVRDKSHDYGIDLEVEIFNEDDTATGILFYVQLKATFSREEKKQKRVSIDIGTLQYYQELDLPVLIARYAEATNEFHFKWSHEVPIPEEQKTTTVTFGDLGDFTDYSPVGLKKTATALRKLRRSDGRATINLDITFGTDFTTLDPARCLRIIRQALPVSKRLTVNENKGDNTVNITATLKADKLLFHIDSLWPTTLGLGEWQERNLTSDFMYGLCTFLMRAQQGDHARLFADELLGKQHQTENRFLAFKTATAFGTDIAKALEMSLLNNVHHQVDEFWISLNSYIFAQDVLPEDKSNVIVALNQASIEQLSEEAPAEVIAPLHYNIGNSYKSISKFFEALRSYNKARKINPDYMERDYFLQEVGSVMFQRKHFTPAAKFYQLLLDKGEDDRRLYCLADALFFSGKLRQALELFEKICVKNLNSFTFEVILKSALIAGLIEQHPKGEIKRNQVEATRRLLTISDKLNTLEAFQVYQEVASSIDPLDATSAFNLAVDASHSQKHEEASIGFLIQAFTHTNDAEAWVNAFACAISTKEIPHVILAAIAGLGHHFCGSDFNNQWDKLCCENQLPDHVINGCEAVFAYLLNLAELDKDESFTLRLAPGSEPSEWKHK